MSERIIASYTDARFSKETTKTCVDTHELPLAMPWTIEKIKLEQAHLYQHCEATWCEMYSVIPLFAILGALLLTVPLIASFVAFRHARNNRKVSKQLDAEITAQLETVPEAAARKPISTCLTRAAAKAQRLDIEMTNLPFSRSRTTPRDTERPVSPLSQPESVDLNPQQQSERQLYMVTKAHVFTRSFSTTKPQQPPETNNMSSKAVQRIVVRDGFESEYSQQGKIALKE